MLSLKSQYNKARIKMTWLKKIKTAANCSGVFSIQDYANFTVIATSNFLYLDSENDDARRLRQQAYQILYCPVMNLITEGKKAVGDHLRKLAFHKSGRFFGNPEEVNQITEQTEARELKRILEQSTRSPRHRVETLREKLEEEGIDWSEAEEIMSVASIYNDKLEPLD